MNVMFSQQVKLALAMTLSVVALSGCGNKAEKTDNQTAASAAEAAAVPMSAAPANETGKPAIINESNAMVDAGPDAAASTADVATATASGVDAAGDEAMDGGADNSAMDKISENDQVIDDQPASPNAPRAADEGESVPAEKMSNAKVGQ